MSTGKELVDYITDYLETIRTRPVFPNVKPGYMKDLLPDSAPINGESWQHIFADIERVIMPGKERVIPTGSDQIKTNCL